MTTLSGKHRHQWDTQMISHIAIDFGKNKVTPTAPTEQWWSCRVCGKRKTPPHET